MEVWVKTLWLKHKHLCLCPAHACPNRMFPQKKKNSNSCASIRKGSKHSIFVIVSYLVSRFHNFFVKLVPLLYFITARCHKGSPTLHSTDPSKSCIHITQASTRIPTHTFSSNTINAIWSPQTPKKRGPGFCHLTNTVSQIAPSHLRFLVVAPTPLMCPFCVWTTIMWDTSTKTRVGFQVDANVMCLHGLDGGMKEKIGK